MRERRVTMEADRDLDLIGMEIITHAGNARSLAIEAIRAAKAGDFGQAEANLKACESEMVEAHHFQTDLLASEAQGTPIPVSIFMVHAQDHIMNAMTVKDLAVELVEIIKQMN